jgi:hypothetical protein
MAWSTPRTWNAGETVTASLMNAHVRDNLNVLKTYIDDDGSHRILVKGFAFSSGQSNNAGGSDTQLTSYDVTIPANLLSQPGDTLIVEGTFTSQSTSEAKTAKLQVGSGTSVTIWTATVGTSVIQFRMLIRRRTSTTGAITGVAWRGAAAADPVGYVVNALTGTVDWTASQTLKIYAASATATQLTLADYFVSQARGLTGTTV